MIKVNLYHVLLFHLFVELLCVEISVRSKQLTITSLAFTGDRTPPQWLSYMLGSKRVYIGTIDDDT